MKQKWLNLILHLSGIIFRKKSKILYANGLKVSVLFFQLFFLELAISIISLPMYFFITRNDLENTFGANPHEVKIYLFRRKLTFTTVGLFLLTFGVKMVFVFYGSVDTAQESNASIMIPTLASQESNRDILGEEQSRIIFGNNNNTLEFTQETEENGAPSTQTESQTSEMISGATSEQIHPAAPMIPPQKRNIKNIISTLSDHFTEDYQEGTEAFWGGSKDAKILISGSGIDYQFIQQDEEAKRILEKRLLEENKSLKDFTGPKNWLKVMTFQLSFLDANPTAKAEGSDALKHYTNYYLGNKSTQWKKNVQNFKNILIRDLYKDIDFQYEAGKDLKYDYILKPGADPRVIKNQFAGIENLKLETNGDITISTPEGKVSKKKPYCYQNSITQPLEVECQYEIIDNFTFGFDISGEYDKTKDLVIDPIFDYSTFVGTTDEDFSTYFDTDIFGNIYILVNSRNVILGHGDISIFKLNPAGVLQYSTVIGGDNADTASDIQVGPTGVFFGGSTTSTDYPTSNLSITPLPAISEGRSEFFATKLDLTNGNLLYSTHFGERGDDGLNFSRFTIDSNENMFLVGDTRTDCLGNNGGPGNVYAPCEPHSLLLGTILFKIKTNGTDIDYLTYLDSGIKSVSNLLIDRFGNIYIGGSYDTSPGYFPGALGSLNDGFVMKINANFTTRTMLFNVGGAGNDTVTAIAMNSSDQLLFSGETASDDFLTNLTPFPSSYAQTRNAFLGFLLKGDPSDSTLINGTFVDGIPKNIAIDTEDNIYVVGKTYNNLTTTPGSFQSTRGECGECGFLSKFTSDLVSLTYSTYLNGNISDSNIYQIQVPVSNEVYVAGVTFDNGSSNSDYPITLDASDTTFNGDSDGFFTKFKTQGDTHALRFVINPSTTDPNSVVQAQVEVLKVDSNSGDDVRNTSDSSTVVTLTLSGGDPTAVLSGNVATVINGLATFPNLKIDKVGTGYTLKASF